MVIGVFLIYYVKYFLMFIRDIFWSLFMFNFRLIVDCIWVIKVDCKFGIRLFLEYFENFFYDFILFIYRFS